MSTSSREPRVVRARVRLAAPPVHVVEEAAQRVVAADGVYSPRHP